MKIQYPWPRQWTLFCPPGYFRGLIVQCNVPGANTAARKARFLLITWVFTCALQSLLKLFAVSEQASRWSFCPLQGAELDQLKSLTLSLFQLHSTNSENLPWIFGYKPWGELRHRPSFEDPCSGVEKGPSDYESLACRGCSLWNLQLSSQVLQGPGAPTRGVSHRSPLQTWAFLGLDAQRPWHFPIFLSPLLSQHNPHWSSDLRINTRLPPWKWVGRWEEYNISIIISLPDTHSYIQQI